VSAIAFNWVVITENLVCMPTPLLRELIAATLKQQGNAPPELVPEPKINRI